MALAITKTPVNIKQAGGRRFRFIELTYDAAYAAGGYAISAADLALSTIESITPGAMAGAGATGFLAIWDAVALKMKVYKTGTAAAPFDEAATNQTSLTGLKSQHWVVGY